MTNETRTIEEIDASLRRNNRHRSQAIADRTFYTIMEHWDQVEIAQKDVALYDSLNDRFLDERLHVRTLEATK